MKIRVEVDLYSGRPNPAWELSSDEGRQFLAHLDTLPERKAVTARSPGLGYRGFKINCEGTGDAVSMELFVAKGRVELGWSNSTKQWLDWDRRLERWLCSTGKHRLDDATYAYLLGQFPETHPD